MTKEHRVLGTGHILFGIPVFFFVGKDCIFVKSECELQYDRFVVSNLCHAAISEKERVSLMLDFINSREERYDLLCEHVYLQAMGEADHKSLWLTPFGESYFATTCKSKDDICLLTEISYRSSQVTVSDYIEQLIKDLSMGSVMVG